MHAMLLRWRWLRTFLLVCFALWPGRGRAQITGLSEPEREGGWVKEWDPQAGVFAQTMELTLHAAPEPRPALKYRFLPDDFGVVDGNAAVYYLKAAGFFEQNAARRAIDQAHNDAYARAQKEGKEYADMPPALWLSLPPDELPVDEVKAFLRLTAFQPPMLREAARRAHYDLDRNLPDVSDPIGYLLPEIQSMRELARTQSLRCRVAISEGRIDDAIEITGQQFALARHLGQDDFLVSHLVGIAVAGIAWNDALYLLQHPDTPNLFWAFAAMPSPLVDIRHSLSVERQFLYRQLRVLDEVDETPRPAGYWQDFIDRLVPQIGTLAPELNLPSVEEDPELVRAALVAYVAAAYPGAKEYLIQETKLPPDFVRAYPTAQVVFLAMVRFHNQWRDEYFKWSYLPFWQVHSKARESELHKSLRAASDRYGWCSMPTNLLLPAVTAARTAQARCDQTIALLQTVEAIRMYGAAHGGRLPRSLEDLPVPAPLEPFTGEPVEYELRDTIAVLRGHALPGLRYQLMLRLAQPSQ